MTDGPGGRGDAGPGVRLTPQLLFGLLVIATGLLFTLDNLGILRADEYLRFWPAALVAVGALKLWQSRRGSGAMAGLTFITIGLWLLLDELTVWRVGFGDLWPLLLVLFGGYLVWQGLSEQPPRELPPPAPDPGPRFGPLLAPQLAPPFDPTPGRESRPPGGEPQQPAQPFADQGGARLSALAILGAVSRSSRSQGFRGADLTAIMGGCELDLRNAAINGEAVIDVFALWGGIEIRVPEGWQLDSRVVPILGGVDEKIRPARPGSGTHRLVLRGFAIMGGVEVKS